MSFQAEIFVLATKDYNTFILTVQIYRLQTHLVSIIMYQNLAYFYSSSIMAKIVL